MDGKRRGRHGDLDGPVSVVVIPSEARDPHAAGRGPYVGSLRIPRLTARGDMTAGNV
jgi:hypothetical protein